MIQAIAIGFVVSFCIAFVAFRNVTKRTQVVEEDTPDATDAAGAGILTLILCVIVLVALHAVYTGIGAF